MRQTKSLLTPYMKALKNILPKHEIDAKYLRAGTSYSSRLEIEHIEDKAGNLTEKIISDSFDNRLYGIWEAVIDGYTSVKFLLWQSDTHYYANLEIIKIASHTNYSALMTIPIVDDLEDAEAIIKQVFKTVPYDILKSSPRFLARR